MPETLEVAADTRAVGFVQLCKFDVDTGTFEGTMASESPDHANEVFDYETSKPHFKAWAETFRGRTGGKSLGNVREMHGLKAAGKLTRVAFDDAAKAIQVTGKIVDAETRTKVAEGVLTGLSIGGTYLKTWRDPANPRLTRYTAQPAEVSLVDNPCNPDATIEVRQGGAVKLVKAVGRDAVVAFEEDAVPEELQKATTKRVDGKDLTARSFAYVGDPERTETWKFPIHDASHVRNALARWGQAKGIPADEKAKVFGRIKAAAKRFGIEVSAEAEKLVKSLYDVGGVAMALATLAGIRQCLEAEAAVEGDDSPVPAQLADILRALGAVVVDVADEEVNELLAGLGESNAGVEKMAAQTPETLPELEAALAAEIAAGAKLAKSAEDHHAVKEAHHQRMAELTSKIAEQHEKLAAHYAKGAKAEHEDAEDKEEAPAEKVTKAAAPLTREDVAQIATDAVVNALKAILAPEPAPVQKAAAAKPALGALTGVGGVVLQPTDTGKTGAAPAAAAVDPEAQKIAALRKRATGTDEKDAEAARAELETLAAQRFAKAIRDKGQANFTGVRVA